MTISLDNSNMFGVSIYTLSGELVFSKGGMISQEFLDVSFLTKGSYIVELESESLVGQKLFIVH